MTKQMNPTVRAFVELPALLVAMALFVFVPAGTLHYWQGWVFLACYMTAETVVTVYLLVRDPALLKRRQQGSPFAEDRPAQKIIIFLALIGFFGLIVLPGLDRRYGWSHMPSVAAIVGDVLVLLGRAGILAVFRENTFTSATVEVADNQRVIATGPYSVVRHPMYTAALLMLLGIPLALGSLWAEAIVAVMLLVLIWRITDEERFLVEKLQGYREYRHKVRYRLLPGLW